MFDDLDPDEMYWLARDDRRISEAIMSSYTTASAGPVRATTPSVEDIVKRASRGYQIGKLVDGKFIVESEVPEVTFWERLKHEFMLLVCTSDEKYKDVRQKLKASAGKSQTLIVSTVSAGIASYLGVVAGVLVPFCALCLFALASMGQAAFCAGQSFATVAVPNKAPPSKKGKSL